LDFIKWYLTEIIIEIWKHSTEEDFWKSTDHPVILRVRI